MTWRSPWMRAVFWLSVVVLVAWAIFANYDAFIAADKSCLRASVGSPAGPAKEHLRAIARAHGAQVRESADRTSVVFRWMLQDAYGCVIVERDAKVIEVYRGKSALRRAK